MRAWLIRKLGGYPPDEILTRAVKDLFNTINEEDILHQVANVWFLQGKSLNDAQKSLIVSEAKTIQNSLAWKAIQLDIRYQANLRMFERSKTEMDLIAGKLWLYIIDCINTRLNSMSKGSAEFNAEAVPKRG